MDFCCFFHQKTCCLWFENCKNLFYFSLFLSPFPGILSLVKRQKRSLVKSTWGWSFEGIFNEPLRRFFPFFVGGRGLWRLNHRKKNQVVISHNPLIPKPFGFLRVNFLHCLIWDFRVRIVRFQKDVIFERRCSTSRLVTMFVQIHTLWN